MGLARLLKSRRDLGQKGDTIIEVMIAVGIVSLVLTAAYAVTNRSVQSSQQAQEQSYGQKLVEQQVELLRAAATKPALAGCFDQTGSFQTLLASCKKTNGGAVYALTVKNISGADYSVQATWETVNGGNADITVYYKVIL